MKQESDFDQDPFETDEDFDELDEESETIDWDDIDTLRQKIRSGEFKLVAVPVRRCDRE